MAEGTAERALNRYSGPISKGSAYRSASRLDVTGSSFSKAFLTDEGYDAIMKNADFGNWGIGGAGLLMETAFTTFGTNYRMKEGEAFLPAFGKELAENAIYGLAPQLAVGMIGSMAVQAYPQIKDAAAQKQYYANNMNYLGGDYLDTQKNHASRARAMEHIKRTRSSIASSIGGEARRHHRT